MRASTTDCKIYIHIGICTCVRRASDMRMRRTFVNKLCGEMKETSISYTHTRLPERTNQPSIRRCCVNNLHPISRHSSGGRAQVNRDSFVIGSHRVTPFQPSVSPQPRCGQIHNNNGLKSQLTHTHRTMFSFWFTDRTRDRNDKNSLLAHRTGLSIWGTIFAVAHGLFQSDKKFKQILSDLTFTLPEKLSKQRHFGFCGPETVRCCHNELSALPTAANQI